MTRNDREYWNQRLTDQPWRREPSPWLVRSADLFPESGTALDIAGGTGRNALWLAQRGWDVTVVDVSDVALGFAVSRAVELGVTIDTSLTDLSAEPVPAGEWNATLLFHCLDRPLLPKLIASLAPGGLLVGVLATRTNLERNERPPLPYLIDEGELPTLLDGLDLLRYEEGWLDNHHEARFVGGKN